MTSLQDYFNTNFTKCPPPSSFIATPDFLSIGSKIQAFILIPICLFGLWCILYKTPKYMTAFKWHLLHLHTWFLILTIFYTLLTTPYHFFPAQARCTLGFFEVFGIPPLYQLILVQLVYGGIICAVVLLFENRHSHLVPCTEKRYQFSGKLRVLLGVVNYCFGSSNALSTLNNDSSPEHQDALKLEYLKMVPCPDAIYFTTCTYASEKPKGNVPIYMLIAVIAVLLQLGFFIIHSFSYLRRSRIMDTFSERTKKIQRAFFHAALAQIAAPIVVVFVPMIFLAYILATVQYIPVLINMCILATPTNSVFSTAALLYFVTPYRQFIKEKLRMGSATQEEFKSRGTLASSVQL